MVTRTTTPPLQMLLVSVHVHSETDAAAGFAAVLAVLAAVLAAALAAVLGAVLASSYPSFPSEGFSCTMYCMTFARTNLSAGG